MFHNLLLNILQRFSYLQQYLIVFLFALIPLILLNYWWCIILLPISTVSIKLFIQRLSNPNRRPWKFSGYLYKFLFRHRVNSQQKQIESIENSIDNELDEFVRTILDRYITIWYDTISPNQQFPHDIQTIFKDFIIRLQICLKGLNYHDLIRSIINRKCLHLEQYLRTIDSYRKQRRRNRLSNSVVEEFSRLIGLHPAIARNDMHSYLKALVKLILTQFLPDSLYVYSTSRLGQEFLTQLLVNCIFQPLMREFSKPRTIYTLLILLLETEDERKNFQENENSFDEQTELNTELNGKQSKAQNDSFDDSSTSTDDRQTNGSEKIIYSATILSCETAYNSVSGAAYTAYIIHCQTKSPYTADGIHFYHVKRRFREFLNLQKRLQMNPKTSRDCYDLKEIFRSLPIPMDNMNPDVISNRKIKLEIYIQKLITNDVLNCSHDVLEFFAYNSNTKKQFELAASSKLPVPRVDKVILRTLSDMGTKINNLLPQKRESVTVRETFQLNVNPKYQDSSATEEYLVEYLKQCEDKQLRSIEENLLQRNLNSSDLKFLRLLTERLNCVTLKSKDKIGSKIPLTDAILNLVYTCLHSRDTIINNESIHQMLRILFGHFTEELLKREIDDALSEEKILSYLTDLRTKVLWPDDTQTSAPMKNVKHRAYNTFINKIPKWLQYIIGVENTRQIITNLLQCFSYEELNRHFLCNILDLIIEKLISDIATEPFLQKYVRLHAEIRN